MWVSTTDAYAADLGEMPETPGGGVPVHPGPAGVEQDRPCKPVADRAVDGATDRGWQRDQDDLGSLSAHPEHAMAMFLPEVGDVGTGRFEDPQAEQAEHRDEREVAVV